jgi:hypothetical protein
MYVCMNPRAVANAYKDMRYIVEMDRHEGFSDSELNTVRGSNWLASYSATSWFVSNVIYSTGRQKCQFDNAGLSFGQVVMQIFHDAVDEGE